MGWSRVSLAGLALWACGQVCAQDFQPCSDTGSLPELAGSRCATVTAPLVYGEPAGSAGRTVTLFVRQIPAKGPSHGTVWLIAGGPGESGASFYPLLAQLQRSFPGMDLMLPDHRGTGYSSRLCPDEEKVDSEAGMALAGAEWGSCFGRLYADLPYTQAYSLSNAARDLDLLIQRYQNKQPTYVYGVSYGTQLVLRMLQLAQPKLAGVILDSLVPPADAPQWDLSHRSVVVDQVGRQWLTECDTQPACQRLLPGGAEKAYRELLAQLPNRPALQSQIPGGNAKQLFAGLLDQPALRQQIPALIADMLAGNDVRLQQVLAQLQASVASLGHYPQAPISIPLVALISGAENNLRPALTRAELQEEEQALLFTSSLPGLLIGDGVPRYDRDAYFAGLPSNLPPTLVLQGTLDPKTPYAGAQAHIARLRQHGKVVLITVAQAPHFILQNAAGCFQATAQRFVAGNIVRSNRCRMTG